MSLRCDICNFRDGHQRMGIIQCKVCKLTVHEECHGTVTQPKYMNDFTCFACRAVGRSFEAVETHLSTKIITIKQRERPTRCALCSVSSGIHAMHPLYDNHGMRGRQICRKVKGEWQLMWAHSLCAYYFVQKGLLYGCMIDGRYDQNAEDKNYQEEADNRSPNPALKRAVDVSRYYETHYGSESTHHFRYYLRDPKIVSDRDLDFYTKAVEEHKKGPKCYICGLDDKADSMTMRIATQCVANDPDEFKDFKGKHPTLSNGIPCFEGLHVGCARWGANPSNVQRVYFFPGDVSKDPVKCIYCSLHAQDVDERYQKRIKEQQLAKEAAAEQEKNSKSASVIAKQKEVHQRIKASQKVNSNASEIHRISHSTPSECMPAPSRTLKGNDRADRRVSGTRSLSVSTGTVARSEDTVARSEVAIRKSSLPERSLTDSTGTVTRSEVAIRKSSLPERSLHDSTSTVARSEVAVRRASLPERSLNDSSGIVGRTNSTKQNCSVEASRSVDLSTFIAPAKKPKEVRLKAHRSGDAEKNVGIGNNPDNATLDGRAVTRRRFWTNTKFCKDRHIGLDTTQAVAVNSGPQPTLARSRRTLANQKSIVTDSKVDQIVEDLIQHSNDELNGTEDATISRTTLLGRKRYWKHEFSDLSTDDFIVVWTKAKELFKEYQNSDSYRRKKPEGNEVPLDPESSQPSNKAVSDAEEVEMSDEGERTPNDLSDSLRNSKRKRSVAQNNEDDGEENDISTSWNADQDMEQDDAATQRNVEQVESEENAVMPPSGIEATRQSPVLTPWAKLFVGPYFTGEEFKLEVEYPDTISI